MLAVVKHSKTHYLLQLNVVLTIINHVIYYGYNVQIIQRKKTNYSDDYSLYATYNTML